MKHKHFVSVRTAYYKHTEQLKQINKKQKSFGADGKQQIETVAVTKKYRSAIAILDHVSRSGTTKSANVITNLSKNNYSETPTGTNNIVDSYYHARRKYKQATGREFRSDGNTLFEHIIVLSESHVVWLEEKLGQERAKEEIANCIRNYSSRFAKGFKFTELGFSLHYDEGNYDENGSFKRNVHAHVLFFNYCFESKKSNLKYLAKKGVDHETGRTHPQNQNFVAIQDLAAKSFKRLHFRRGISALKTLAKHLPKHQFLLRKLAKAKQNYKNVLNDIERLKVDFMSYFKEWFEFIHASKNASHNADLAYETLETMHDESFKSDLTNVVSSVENCIKKETKLNISDDESISKKLSKKRRKNNG